jgi:hypothetical protein
MVSKLLVDTKSFFYGGILMTNVADEFGAVMCAIISTLAILMFLLDD